MRRRLGFLSLLLIASVPLESRAAVAQESTAPALVTMQGDARLQVIPGGGEDLPCLELEVGARASDGRCAEGPVLVIGREPPRFRTTRIVAAAVPPEVTRVELRRGGRLLGEGVPLDTPAYRGEWAGEVRFVLLRLPAAAPADGLRLRTLDAQGSLVRVLSDTGVVDADGEEGDDTFLSDRTALLRGRVRGVPWRIGRERSSVLEPSLVDPEREAVTDCLTTSVSGVAGGFDDFACSAEQRVVADDGDLAQPRTIDACRARFRVLHGLSDRPLASVSVLLGDGRRRRARVVPAVPLAASAWAIVLPESAAVRSVRLRRRTGSTHTTRLALAPLRVACAVGATSIPDGLFDPTRSLYEILDRQPRAIPAGPASAVPGLAGSRVADGVGGTLCLAAGGRAFGVDDCDVVAPDGVRVTVDRYARPRAFLAAVPANVATIRVGPSRGRLRSVPTVELPAYRGSYAGRVRFAGGRLRSLDDLGLIDLVARDGTRLATDGLGSAVPVGRRTRIGAPVRLAGVRGRPSLWRTSTRVDGLDDQCLALTPGPRPSRSTLCAAQQDQELTVLLDAPCTTRRLTVAVVAKRGTRAGLNLARSRSLRLPAGASVRTLPRGARLDGLTVRRARDQAERFRLRVPSARAQCGWRLETSLGDLRSGRQPPIRLD